MPKLCGHIQETDNGRNFCVNVAPSSGVGCGTRHDFRSREEFDKAVLAANGASAVDHPRHYNAHPSGIECIDVVEHMGFNLGNAIKYIWRADEKGNALQDLEKARWYVEREIEKRKKASNGG